MKMEIQHYTTLPLGERKHTYTAVRISHMQAEVLQHDVHEL